MTSTFCSIIIGTDQVKKSKVGILTLNYETFMMRPEEDIKAISDKFTIIINELMSHGKTYPNEVVQKMLRSLPMSWDTKLTTIEKVKKLETLSLDELIGSLLTHKMRLKGVNKEEEKVEKKKVGIALKYTIEEGSSGDDVDEDQEMTMFARRFKRSIKQKLKAHVATWSDEGSSSNDDEEVAIFALWPSTTLS
ncbi:UBN2 domain-containing protein [Gossypium australe]|uniref:UBN2 domain-containing protein n=1 Tax=Gossypium australe TaxID=47621 RepID=A0A5B6VWV6_9ROSI|nr:UBN2 domain-containing protein [Gossypium australe]